jgi:hypothetical protein
VYDDPRRIRRHTVKVNLDDFEIKAIDRLVSMTGKQRQVLLRELLMRQAERELTADKQPIEGPIEARKTG